MAKAAPTKEDRSNKKRLGELRRMEAGGDLGLDPRERDALGRQLEAPSRSAAADLLSRTAGAAASRSQADVGAQARLQRDAADVRAQGVERTASAVADADARKTRALRQEIEDRSAYRRQRRTDSVNSLLDAATSIASAAGQHAGDVPEVGKMMGPYGGAVRDFGAFRETLAAAGFPPGDIDAMERMERNAPGSLARALAQVGSTNYLPRGS